tara:strand:- start:20 stop:472 length:453 start_codon:yes stop_codon:yes gene_type:complete
MWLFNAFIYPMWVPSLSSRASNGDAFGAVNALFSGLAFAGLIYTMIMQSKELALQREELAMQRQEMKDSRGELVEQNRIQAEQVELRKKELEYQKIDLEFRTLERRLDFSKWAYANAEQYKVRLQAKEVISNLETELELMIAEFGLSDSD